MTALLALGALLTTPAHAQTDYVLSAGDVVVVDVYGEPELGRTARIGGDCVIDLPLVGALEACRSSALQLQERVADALGEYLVHPRVTVTIETYGGRTIEIKGAVATPGVLPLKERTNLSQAITLAGGPQSGAVVHAQLVRGGERTDIYLPTLERDGAAMWVEDGDVIVLLPASQVYVLGEVEEAGPVPYQDGLSVSQAIALAGGQTDFGGRRAVLVRAGDQVKSVLNLRRIQLGLDEDAALGPDDKLLIRRAVF